MRWVKPSIATVSPSRTRSATASRIDATLKVLIGQVSGTGREPRWGCETAATRLSPLTTMRCGGAGAGPARWRAARMTSMGMAGSAGSWANQVRALFYVAMAVFLVTIGIGLLNGLDIVEFNPDELLTHVHSGTLGWITLTLVAASAWFARGIDARLAWALAIVIPVYVLAFYLAVPWLRAVVGGALLIVILWLVVWAWGIYTSRRSLPALAIALGFTTFTYGAVIGVLRQVQLADGPNLFPATADPIGAHASAMVFSYLILVAMGLLEWRGSRGLRPRRDGDLPVRRLQVHQRPGHRGRPDLDRRRPRRERPLGIHRGHHESRLRAAAHAHCRPRRPLAVGNPGRVLGHEPRPRRLHRRARRRELDAQDGRRPGDGSQPPRRPRRPGDAPPGLGASGGGVGPAAAAAATRRRGSRRAVGRRRGPR